MTTDDSAGGTPDGTASTRRRPALIGAVTLALVVVAVAVVALVLVLNNRNGTVPGDDAAGSGSDRPGGEVTTPGTDDVPGDAGGSHDDATGDSGTSAGTTLVDAVCSDEVTVSEMGPIGSTDIDEASGLAASVSNPGIWWTHNDSGGRPEVYALDDTGRLVATVRLLGADAIDWEDIAVAVDDSGDEIVHVGDIGDNDANREHLTIYSFRAPRLADGDGAGSMSPATIDVHAAATYVSYPDGPRDAEALLADRRDGALYVIDKDWSLQGHSTVHRVMIDDMSVAPTSSGGSDGAETDAENGTENGALSVVLEMEHVADLRLPSVTLVTAADVSPDGSAVAVRGYGIEMLYHRGADDSIVDALTAEHCVGPNVDEMQGEAIAFAADNRSYITVDEGSGSVLHRVGPH